MPNDVSEFIPLSPRDYLILLALSQGERHGYALIKDVSTRTNGDVKLDPANLYRSLKRLIGNGLLDETERRAAPDERDERRRYYTITALGKNVLRAEALRLDQMAQLARATDLLPPDRSAS